MVERQLPKLHTRVRFPSPAPSAYPREINGLYRDGAGTEFFSANSLQQVYNTAGSYFAALGATSAVCANSGYRRTKVSKRVRSACLGRADLRKTNNAQPEMTRSGLRLR
jgi:hypothetical protein